MLASTEPVLQVCSKGVVLKLGSSEPQGFGEAIAGVRSAKIRLSLHKYRYTKRLEVVVN